jgi:hypothetical protein
MRFDCSIPEDFAASIVPSASGDVEQEAAQTLHFGRYEGRVIETVPRFYLSWVRVFGGISEDQRAAIEAHLQAGRKR